MKTFCLLAIGTAALLAAACGKVLPDEGYALEIPELPVSWEHVLGKAHWRIEYVDASGVRAVRNLLPGERAVLDPPQTWASAVLAWAYWPDRNIPAGVFRPAGALFPYDAAAGSGGIRASWNGGIDAFLYWELARAAQVETAALQAKVPRLPANFNWPRFRQLLADEETAEAIRTDPWRADWSGIAVKIARSGFDKRRIVPEVRRQSALPVRDGVWVGTSPFAPPLVFDADTPPVFPLGEKTEVWITDTGMLRANTKAWGFWEW